MIQDSSWTYVIWLLLDAAIRKEQSHYKKEYILSSSQIFDGISDVGVDGLA